MTGAALAYTLTTRRGRQVRVYTRSDYRQAAARMLTAAKSPPQPRPVAPSVTSTSVPAK